MSISKSIPQSLAQLGSQLNNIPTGQYIFLYKGSNGVIQASATANSQITNNTGYQFQFPDGSIIYTMPPISDPNNIPWTYTYSILGSLWGSQLKMWLDCMEAKSISVSTQKIMSKGYSNNFLSIENTANPNSFVYSSNTVDMTNGSNLLSYSVQPIYVNFALGLVCSIPTQNFTNGVIFQHNRFAVKVASNAAADGSTQYMIATFDNGSFMRGVSFKPSDPTFKYFIYTDQTGALVVSGNTSFHTNTPSYFTTNPNSTIYIGQDSSNFNNSQIKLNEVLYYQSSALDIPASASSLYSYFSTRWGLTTYADSHNIPPIPTASGSYTMTTYVSLGTTYYVYTFTGNGSLTANGNISIDFLAAGGGGSGGYRTGGGGGAGELIMGTNIALGSGATYSFVVGAGAVSSLSVMTSGSNTTAFGYTALGGGAGGGSIGRDGLSGGCGGGAGESSYFGTPGAATGGFTYVNGTNSQNGAAYQIIPYGMAGGPMNGAYGVPFMGSGGGGVGSTGGAGGTSGITTNVGSMGGGGISSDINGTSTYYCAGGGGMYYNSGTTTQTARASGVGGAAGNGSNPDKDGLSYGCGGGASSSGSVPGGSGSQGVVIIRYPRHP